jgi:hypothetical protein
MSRPKKEYCDYFSHDRDMRNHRKIKALRLKYGIQGYAIWVMFLEFLTGNDNNIFKNTDIELELLSGDFGVPANEIIDIINYCLKLNLLVEKDGVIYSESLNERLEYVYNKRKKNKNTSEQQPRSNGKYVVHNPIDTVVSVTETHLPVTETPQSKVKGIEVNKNSVINVNNETHANLENSNLFRKPNIPTKENVWEFFSGAGGTKDMAKAFYDKHDGTGWFINGSPIVKWQSLANSFITNWNKIEEQRKNKGISNNDQSKVQTLRKLPSSPTPKYD